MDTRIEAWKKEKKDLILSTIIGETPVLGSLIVAINDRQRDQRISKLEEALNRFNIAQDKFKELISTEDGYILILELVENFHKCHKNKIDVFVAILKDCCDKIDLGFNTQYNSIILKTINTLTEFEMYFLKCWIKYVEENKNVETDQNLSYMEIDWELGMGNKNCGLYAYLQKKDDNNIDTKTLLENVDFLIERLVSIGVAIKGNKIDGSYYITGLGKGLIEFIRKSEQKQSE